VKFVGQTDFSRNPAASVRNIYEIHGLEVHFYHEVLSNPSGEPFQISTLRPNMRKRGDTDKPPFIKPLKGRKFGEESHPFGGVYYSEISEDGSRIRTLYRNKEGEITDFTAQGTTEPRRVP
jgi:hypothetical protein